MSIYPVLLSEWFPPGDEMHDMAYMMVTSFRCYACGGKNRWKKAISLHSLPWGYGDAYCGWDCYESGGTYKPDKRQARKIRRLAKKVRDLWVGVKNGI